MLTGARAFRQDSVGTLAAIRTVTRAGSIPAMPRTVAHLFKCLQNPEVAGSTCPT
jgi:hypothetical protein